MRVPLGAVRAARQAGRLDLRILLTAGAVIILAQTSAAAREQVAAGQFSICRTGGGVNCVVDGDTAWIGGVKVRLAEIDAPETHPPRCRREAVLGERATLRLRALLSAGPFDLRAGERDSDAYGRRLRVAMRGGRSIGDQLRREGLARRWTGRRLPWC